jgi:hypothetical protein
MIIASDSVTFISGSPSAGDIFSSLPDMSSMYVGAAKEVYENQAPIIACSPPVVNTDDRSVYPFPNPGGDDMLGRQMSGLWTKETSTAREFITAVYAFDQKMSFNMVSHDTRIKPYASADGPRTTPRISLSNTGSFTTGSTAPLKEYEIPFYPSFERGHIGTNIGDHDANSYASKFNGQMSYEVFFGTDNASNYGPMNFSNGDLVTMSAYTLSRFSETNQTTVPGGTVRNVQIPDCNPVAESVSDEPVIMQISSSINTVAYGEPNVYVQFTRTYLKFDSRE